MSSSGHGGGGSRPNAEGPAPEDRCTARPVMLIVSGFDDAMVVDGVDGEEHFNVQTFWSSSCDRQSNRLDHRKRKHFQVEVVHHKVTGGSGGEGCQLRLCELRQVYTNTMITYPKRLGIKTRPCGLW